MVKPIWKCKVKDCDFTAPPTLEGFNEIVGHQLHHSKEGTPKEKRGFHLIDQGTGVLLARTLKKARAKGLLEPTSPPTPTPPVVPPEETADSADQQIYDKGYEEGYEEGYDAGSKETEEAIRKVPFEIKVPQYGGGIRGHVGDLFELTRDPKDKDEEITKVAYTLISE